MSETFQRQRLWEQYQAFARYADMMDPKWREKPEEGEFVRLFGVLADHLMQQVQDRHDEMTRETPPLDRHPA